MPETATLTLTEFLLARIAEDEASAVDGETPDDSPDLDALALDWHARRMLAECEAKRRIVQDHGFRESGRETLSIFGERIFGTLAAVYADHPDYRQEWAA